jgi:hypothetical protein
MDSPILRLTSDGMGLPLSASCSFALSGEGVVLQPLKVIDITKIATKNCVLVLIYFQQAATPNRGRGL